MSGWSRAGLPTEGRGEATLAPLGLGFVGPRGSGLALIGLALIDFASVVVESARNWAEHDAEYD